jgi:AcrR family transcriptional regulator
MSSDMSLDANAAPPARRSYGGMTAAERHALRRRRLVDAALELFGTAGYAATSIETVCATAGVSTRNFYDHFNNRESLLIAVYDQITEDAQKAILEAVLVAGLTLEQQARSAIEAFAHAMLDDERRARINFIEVLGASPRVEARRREVIRNFAHMLETFAEEHMRQGTIPSRDAWTGSLALIGGVQEVLRDWVTGTERPPLAPIIDDLVTLFVAAARA